MNSDGSNLSTALGSVDWESRLRESVGKILEYARSGIPRQEFLKEVSRIFREFSGSDIVRLVIIDHGRRYRSETGADPDTPFRFDVTQEYLLHRKNLIWSAGEDPAVENLCVDIIGFRAEPSEPWFTRNGSFLVRNRDALAESGIQPRRVSGEAPHELGITLDVRFASVALLPVEIGQQRTGLIQFCSLKEDAFSDEQIVVAERLARIFGISLSHRWLQVELRERVKELTCLYGISKLVAQPGISLEEVLESAVRLLPPGWLRPESAAARIVVDDKAFTSPRFERIDQSMTASIVINGAVRGKVEVGYIGRHPQLDEGPFLHEERSLIDTIAHELSIIIEQKQAEMEKEKLQKQLRHTDRLATLGQLAAGVAHELNEPLANILGFAQLSLKDTGLPEQVRADLEKITRASLHAREVIKKLLYFGRETAPSRTEIDINDVIEDSLYFLQSRCAKAGIDLVRALDPGLPRIIADRPQMLQVLTNLVVNSIQAMPRGGQIHIGTTMRPDALLLRVRDTGVGMTREVLDKVFNPFFTTKSVDQGTGLGLSVVHGIITAHQGTIDIDSRPGEGTTISISLPFTGEEQTKKDQYD